MEQNKTARHAASYAVADLRKAMGQTQTEFATQTLKMAISSIARFETSAVPPGDVLLRLGNIAEAEALKEHYSPEQKLPFIELRDAFRGFYIESEIFAKPEFEEGDDTEWDGRLKRYFFPSPNIGYLLLKLKTDEELAAADDFMGVFAALRSADPERRKAAVAAMKVLKKAAGKIPARKATTEKEKKS